MSVIVNDYFLAYLLHLQPRTGRSKGAKADGDPEHPVQLRANRSQWRNFHRCGRGCRRAGSARGGTASSQQAGSSGGSYKLAAIHCRLLIGKWSRWTARSLDGVEAKNQDTTVP